MKKEFLEAGKIINTFGIRGELKVQPWSDRVDFLKQFKTIYISGQPVRVVSVRVHQQNALLTLEGVTDMDSALPYKNKIIEVRRISMRSKAAERLTSSRMSPPLCRRSMKRKGLSPFMCWRAWANDVD